MLVTPIRRTKLPCSITGNADANLITSRFFQLHCCCQRSHTRRREQDEETSGAWRQGQTALTEPNQSAWDQPFRRRKFTQKQMTATHVFDNNDEQVFPALPKQKQKQKPATKQPPAKATQAQPGNQTGKLSPEDRVAQLQNNVEQNVERTMAARLAQCQEQFEGFPGSISKVNSHRDALWPDNLPFLPFLNGNVLDINMADSRCWLPLIHHEDGSLVVFAENHPFLLRKAQLRKHRLQMLGHFRGMCSGNELTLSRGGCHCGLELGLVSDSTTARQRTSPATDWWVFKLVAWTAVAWTAVAKPTS
jgi:hypothetical protein